MLDVTAYGFMLLDELGGSEDIVCQSIQGLLFGDKQLVCMSGQ